MLASVAPPIGEAKPDPRCADAASANHLGSCARRSAIPQTLESTAPHLTRSEAPGPSSFGDPTSAECSVHSRSLVCVCALSVKGAGPGVRCTVPYAVRKQVVPRRYVLCRFVRVWPWVRVRAVRAAAATFWAFIVHRAWYRDLGAIGRHCFSVPPRPSDNNPVEYSVWARVAVGPGKSAVLSVKATPTTRPMRQRHRGVSFGPR